MKRLLIAVLMLLSAVTALAQKTAVPFTIPQYLDGNGDPLSAGGMCVFGAGTSTLASTYTTPAGSQANNNPVLFGSDGRPERSGSTVGIYLTPGVSYKLVLVDFTGIGSPSCSPINGVTLWTADDVAALPLSELSLDVSGTAGESLSAGDVVYLSTGAGGTNAGQWYKADSDSAAASIAAVSIGAAPADIASGQQGLIRLAGALTVTGPLAIGADQFVSSTAGGLTNTPPINARRVGQASSTTELLIGASGFRVTPIYTYSEATAAPTISSNVLTLDLSTASQFEVALNANITTLTISNPVTSGRTGAFTVTFTADGSLRTISWPASVKFPGGVAPTMTSTNGKKDVIACKYSTAGTEYLCVVAGQNF